MASAITEPRTERRFVRRRTALPLAALAALAAAFGLARAEEVRPDDPVPRRPYPFHVFGVHEPSGRIALVEETERRNNVRGAHVAVIDVRTGEELGVPALRGDYNRSGAVGRPMFLRDVGSVAFKGFGRHNMYALHVYDVDRDTTRVVYDPERTALGIGSSLVELPDRSGFSFAAWGRRDYGVDPDAGIYSLRLADGLVTKLVGDSTLSFGPHAWSPDGTRMAFYRGRTVPAKGTYAPKELPTQVGILDLANGGVRVVPAPDTLFTEISAYPWSPDGSTLCIVEFAADRSEWVDATIRSRSMRIVSADDLSTVCRLDDPDVYAAGFAPDGRVWAVSPSGLWWYMIATDSDKSELVPTDSIPGFRGQPTFALPSGNMYHMRADTLFRVTPDGVRTPVVLSGAKYEPVRADTEEYSFFARDSLEIPCHRYAPGSLDPDLPVVVFLHGGPPHPLMNTVPQVLGLLDAGFEVVQPAYRGSRVRGTKRHEAGRYVVGVKDVDDVTDCVLDYRTRFGGDRDFAVFGISYGAYLAMLAVAREDAPFVGAVALSGSVRMFVWPHFYAYALSPELDSTGRAERLRLIAPIEQAHRIRVPLLVAGGGWEPSIGTERDWRGMRDRVRANGARAELLYYADDDHTLPVHHYEFVERMAKFLSGLD